MGREALRREQELRARIKRRQRIRRLTIVITIAVIAVSLVVAFYFALNTGSPYSSYVGKPVSASIMTELTGVSNATLSSIGAAAGVQPPNSVSGSPLTSGKLPLILYVGGDYCPYCAVERWSLIVALSRFGEFSGLTYMLSSATDVNPNTPTFSFRGATYTSQYIDFVGVEEFGQDPTTVVQPLTTQQQSLISQFDTCPANGNSGGIPFVDLANYYAVNCGAQANIVLSGKNWTQIASQLDTPTSSTAQAIDGAANTLITAICNLDGHQPRSVCSQSYATLTLSYVPIGTSGFQALYLSAPVRRFETGLPN